MEPSIPIRSHQESMVWHRTLRGPKYGAVQSLTPTGSIAKLENKGHQVI